MRRAARAAGSVAVLALVASLLSTGVAAASLTPYPSDATYIATLSTGTKGHSWAGNLEITFTNSGPSPMSTAYLRLWPNGLFGCSGANGQAIKVSGITGATDHGYEPGLRCSAVRIEIDPPVAVDADATITMDVSVDLPNRNDRFGWWQETAFAGTAMPVLAAADQDGWHLDPYTDAGESYYAPIADYEVAYETPKALKVASAGVLDSSTPLGDGRVRRVFHGEDLRDFAWAAAPFRKVAGVDALGTTVRVWYPNTGSRSVAEGMLANTIRSMDLFAAAFGEYPAQWEEIDVVRSSYTTFGGMEFPSIVFTNPGSGIVAHEVGHQWWMGIVGNDSYRAPFLDEGFAEWAALYVVNRPAAKNPSWCTPLNWPRADTRLTNGMDYWDEFGHYGLVYTYGSCALSDLAQRLGMARFKALLQGYVGDHYLTPMTDTGDFMAAVEDAAVEVPTFQPSDYFERWRIGPEA
ncbi:MAG: M1 family aminopeptidase [Actinomycetota bacterium]